MFTANRELAFVLGERRVGGGVKLVLRYMMLLMIENEYYLCDMRLHSSFSFLLFLPEALLPAMPFLRKLRRQRTKSRAELPLSLQFYYCLPVPLWGIFSTHAFCS